MEIGKMRSNIGKSDDDKKGVSLRISLIIILTFVAFFIFLGWYTDALHAETCLVRAYGYYGLNEAGDIVKKFPASTGKQPILIEKNIMTSQ
ncbi:MAG: hypothetical protein OEV93_02615 [Candidatus Moranbacteria bacterium]|nr:hypothetical protein [Candidatus Moranbacteria bacterium]